MLSCRSWFVHIHVWFVTAHDECSMPVRRQEVWRELALPTMQHYSPNRQRKGAAVLTAQDGKVSRVADESPVWAAADCIRAADKRNKADRDRILAAFNRYCSQIGWQRTRTPTAKSIQFHGSSTRLLFMQRRKSPETSVFELCSHVSGIESKLDQAFR